MEKHLEIFKHIEELYNGDTTDEAVLEYARGNSQKMDAWREAFREYDLNDVLKTIDEYFTKKNNRTPPRIAQIQAMMNACGIGKIQEVTEPAVKYHSPAEELMQADIAAGDCRHLLDVYKLAVAYVLEDLLLTEIPPEVWRKMSFSQRWNLAVDKGLFNNFRQLLTQVCKQNYGKPYQFQSENNMIALGQMKPREADVAGAVASLAAHWRAE